MGQPDIKTVPAGDLEKDRFKKPNFLSGLVFLLLGLAVCYFSLQLGLGSPSKPGPGFMPFLGGLLLALLSLILVLRVLLSDSEAFWEVEVKLGNILLILGAMAAYAFLLERIGFVFVTFVFVGLLIRFIKPQSWRKAVLGGVISSAASYLLFETFLRSQLPRTFLRFF